MRTTAVALAIMASVSSAVAQTPPPIGAPGDALVLTTTATGVQVYECKAGPSGTLAWTFKEPRADLFAGTQKVIQHAAGPSWEHSDGSRIVGKVAAKQDAPAATDIPWLRLDVASRSGNGVLSGADTVLRIDTHGGVKAGACNDAGAIAEVPYTATYVFVHAAK